MSIKTFGGFLVIIEEANPFDEDAALIGFVLKSDGQEKPPEKKNVVWRRSGEARWLGNAYDLPAETVDLLVREHRKDA